MPERIVISFFKINSGKSKNAPPEDVLLTLYLPSVSMQSAVRTAKKQLAEYGDSHGVWVTKEVLSESKRKDVWEKDGDVRVFHMVNGKIQEV